MKSLKLNRQRKAEAKRPAFPLVFRPLKIAHGSKSVMHTTDRNTHMQSVGWNPLAQLDPKSPDFAGDARCIADALIDRSAGGGNNVFFENAAENLLTAFIMWERFSKGDKASLCAVRTRLCLALRDTLKDMSECDHDAIRNAGGRFYTRLTDEKSQSTSVQDVVETVLAGTAFLEDERIGADMMGGAIDFGALHREITTIYLILPVHELQAKAKWLRMFVGLALRGLYKSPPTAGAALPPVLFILDEFANLGRLQEIIKALGAARDYSVQLFMVLQNLSQLKAHYEKEWNLFFAGSGAVVAYAAKDMETAEEISKHCGNREERVPTENVNGGESHRPEAIPLVRPEDVKRIEPGQTIAMIEPCPWPVLARTPVYPETPYAAGLDPNPYYRG